MEEPATNFDLGPDRANTNEATAFTEDAIAGSDSLFDDAFSGEIAKRYEAAKDARQEIEREMLADLRRRDGQYEPEIQARLEAAGGSTVFDNVTDLKCAGAEAMFADALFFSGQPFWALEPTPIPELDETVEARAVQAIVQRAMEGGLDPAQMDPGAFEAAVGELSEKIKKSIVDEAAKRAAGMEELIRDQLAEGGFDEALNDFVVDVCTHKIGALMGPCPQIKRVQRTVGTAVVWEEKLVLATERVSPLDVYPESMSTKPGDGDFFIRRRISNDAAIALRDVPEVRQDKLAEALRRKGGTDETRDEEQAQIAQGTTQSAHKPDVEHELVFWWHWMSRSQVSAFTGDEEPDDALADERVPMMGLMLNGVVVKAQENLDKSGAPNVFIASFRKRPGAFWGYGVSALCKGQQEQINVVARALANNIHKSSMPSYQADHAALVDPKVLTKTFPGQVVYTRQIMGDNRDPVKLLETPNYTPVLLNARNQASQWADEKTGIYPQAYGNPAQVGPAETLGGYQLLRQDQTKTFKRALYNVSQAIAGLIKAYWRWNMLFSDDESVKGDVEVVTRGAVQLYMTSEDSDQMLSALALLSQNPVLQGAAKESGPAWLFREVLRMRRIDPDKVLKSEEDIAAELAAAKEQAAMQQAQEAPPEAVEAPPRPDSAATLTRAQADMIRAQAQARRVELEAEKLSISRAEAVAKIRKAQQDIAASRMKLAAPMPAAVPTMGGAA